MNSTTYEICQPEKCTESSDCITSGYVCVVETGYCIESCETTDICQGPLFCNTDTGICDYSCTDNTDCTGFTNTCIESSDQNVCALTCSEDSNCTDIGLPSSECVTNDELGYGTCIPSQNIVAGGNQCTTDDDCTDGTSCEQSIGLCYVACDTDDDCSGPEQCVDAAEASSVPMVGDMIPIPLPNGTTTCVDPSSTECVTDDDCPEAYKCNSLLQATCYPSCSTDADCATLGFGDDTPCATQTYNLVLTTIDIKFCDPNQTPAPIGTEDDSGVTRCGMIGLMLCVIASVIFL